MWPNPQIYANLAKFTEEILNKKLCAVPVYSKSKAKWKKLFINNLPLSTNNSGSFIFSLKNENFFLLFQLNCTDTCEYTKSVDAADSKIASIRYC